MAARTTAGCRASELRRRVIVGDRLQVSTGVGWTMLDWWRRRRKRAVSVAGCFCSGTPSCLYRDEVDGGFRSSLVRIASGDCRELRRCSICGALWSVDELDKYTDSIVARVSGESDWEVQASAARKKHFLNGLGRTGSARCLQAGCANKEVRGFVLCAEHLWRDDWRR